MSRFVVQDWVGERCTFKMQTVLFCALRGCDTVSKEDPSKILVRRLRSAILHCAEGGGSIFNAARRFNPEKLCDDLDHYPTHWVGHMMHACEIVGYKRPDEWFLCTYFRFAEALHLLPETEPHLDLRLADQQFCEARKRRYRELTPVRGVIVEVEKEVERPIRFSRDSYRG